MHDPGIVPVAVEHFLAEPEEAQGWHAVVLQDDACALGLQEPADSRADRHGAAQVLIAEEGVDLAVPVHGVDQNAHAGASVKVVGLGGAGAVHSEIKLARSGQAHPFEYLARHLRAVEAEHEHRRIQGAIRLEGRRSRGMARVVCIGHQGSSCFIHQMVSVVESVRRPFRIPQRRTGARPRPLPSCTAVLPRRCRRTLGKLG